MLRLFVLAEIEGWTSTQRLVGGALVAAAADYPHHRWMDAEDVALIAGLPIDQAREVLDGLAGTGLVGRLYDNGLYGPTRYAPTVRGMTRR